MIMTRWVSPAHPANKMRYRRVAVIEWDGTTEPKLISLRAKGMVRILREWPVCFVGKENSTKSQYGRALQSADRLIASLALAERIYSELKRVVRDLDDAPRAHLPG